jgi:hypothetical protein
VDLALQLQQTIVASHPIGAAWQALEADSQGFLHMYCMPRHRGLIAAELTGSQGARTEPLQKVKGFQFLLGEHSGPHYTSRV